MKMKKLFVAAVAALSLSLATPAMANIVWATFGPAVCQDYWGTWSYVNDNLESILQWFLFSDIQGFQAIQQGGGGTQAVMDYVVSQAEGCEFP